VERGILKLNVEKAMGGSQIIHLKRANQEAGCL
jgi:hypothetical protein